MPETAQSFIVETQSLFLQRVSDSPASDTTISRGQRGTRIAVAFQRWRSQCFTRDFCTFARIISES